VVQNVGGIFGDLKAIIAGMKRYSAHPIFGGGSGIL
jgi:hypothetical protein